MPPGRHVVMHPIQARKNSVSRDIHFTVSAANKNITLTNHYHCASVHTKVRAVFRWITHLAPWTDTAAANSDLLAASCPWFAASHGGEVQEVGLVCGHAFRMRSYILRRVVPPRGRLPMLAHATAILDAWIVHRIFSVWRVAARSLRRARAYVSQQTLAAVLASWRRISRRGARLRILGGRSRTRYVNALCLRCLRAVYRHASQRRLRRLQYAVTLCRVRFLAPTPLALLHRAPFRIFACLLVLFVRCCVCDGRACFGFCGSSFVGTTPHTSVRHPSLAAARRALSATTSCACSRYAVVRL